MTEPNGAQPGQAADGETGKPPTRKKFLGLGWDGWKPLLEVLAGIGVIITLIFNVISMNASSDALAATNRQLKEAQYESVYGHNLELWRLAADHKELAPYILGGKTPEVDQEGEIVDPSQRAAVVNALDFYAYVFQQRAPWLANHSRRDDLLIAEQQRIDRRGYVDNPDWDDWASWAGTTRGGFNGAPGMCILLDKEQQKTQAYDWAFYNAVKKASIC